MKRVISVLIIMIMALSFTMNTGFAYNPYVSDEVIKISPVRFIDMMTFEEATSVGLGQMLEVSVDVKAGTNVAPNQQATLIVTVCDGAEVLDCVDYSSTILSSSVTTLSAMVMTPNEATDLTVKAYVWDSVDNGRPLASAALVGSDNAEVEDIVIDGVSLEGFSKDVKSYDYTVSAAHFNFPEVSVVTESSAAKAEIIINGKLYEDGSSATIKVTSANGENSDTYVINYTWEQPKVTNASINTLGQFSPLTTLTLQEPQWQPGLEPTIDPSTIPALISSGATTQNKPAEGMTNPYYSDDWTQTNLPEIRSTMYTGRDTWYYRDISPEILGGTVIKVPYDGVAGMNDTSLTNLVTFDINRSAVVYVHNNNNMNLHHFVSDLGFENMNAPYAYRIESYGDYYSYRHLYFYRKEYKVEPGETVTVELPYASVSKMYGIIVKFIDDYTFENNALIKTNGEIVDFPVTRKTFIPTHKDNSLEQPVIWTNIKFYPRYSFDDMNGTSSKVPVLYVEDEYLGGNLLRYPYVINNSGMYNMAEFDVVSSCKVKFIWNHAGTKSQFETWAFMNYDWISTGTDSKQLISNGDAPYNCLIGGVSYEKEFNVIPGEVIHVQIPVYTSDRQLYVYSIPTDLK